LVNWLTNDRRTLSDEKDTRASCLTPNSLMKGMETHV
jgi:hypothetical protein